MTRRNPVVASLPGPRFPHPYSSIAVSPDRSHVVVAGKDTLRVLSVGVHGLSEIRSNRVAKYFRAPSSNIDPVNNNSNAKGYTSGAVSGGEKNSFDLRNFRHSGSNSGAGGEERGTNVTITHVAWSHTKYHHHHHHHRDWPSIGNTINSGNNTSGIIGSGDGSGGIESSGHNNTNMSNNNNIHGVGSSNAISGVAGSLNTIASIQSTSSHHSPQPLQLGIDDNDALGGGNTRQSLGEDSIVAAAGSNGVVVAWHARTALLEDNETNNNNSTSFSSWQQNKKYDAAAAVIGQPEAVLAEHTRAVNRLAWHGRKPDLLLTASQDSTVKLWDRRARGPSAETSQTPKNTFVSWFGFNNISSTNTTASSPRRSIPSWHCASTFLPKCEAVRDIKWSPFIDEAFAIVTDSGILAVYDMRVTARPWIKFPAHAGEATTVDWHPTRPYIIATGGGRDRSVKIWDVQSGLSTESGDFERYNSNTVSSDISDSNEPIRTIPSFSEKLSATYHGRPSSGVGSATGIQGSSGAFHGSYHGGRSVSGSFTPLGSQGVQASTSSTNSTRFNFKGPQVVKRLGDLSISAPITRVQWRPPSAINIVFPSQNDEDYIDHHDAMLAVATAPISGTNYGGAGSIELWSHHRPFMALSIVEGHQDGAVTDFVWMDTPPSENEIRSRKSLGNSRDYDNWVGTNMGTGLDLMDSHFLDDGSVEVPMNDIPVRTNSSNIDYQTNPTKAERSVSLGGYSGTHSDEDILGSQRIWQHILSVGRDGRCLLQNLERGERPISKVPRSTFALAPLSPFQKGSGSLQIMSVHQKVPSGKQNDFALTRLRRDTYTARAPGVFAESPVPYDQDPNRNVWRPKPGGQREPAQNPQLVFSAIDPGDLNEPSSSENFLNRNSIIVAPELVHVSRFAKSYRLRRDASFPTRCSLCLHNSDVAERWFGCGPLSRMWKLLASILDGAGIEHFSDLNDENKSTPKNVMSFLMFSTIRNLLLERADAGDVQTCVAICEVVGVFLPQNELKKSSQVSEDATTIPDLHVGLVREWYFSYIEILHQMCLFSQASELIKTCEDSQVAALNQQSTTIHMSCPVCAKPLEGATEKDKFKNILPIAQRACASCRRRIGMCFVCHTPVKGIYVYCPGCGHGGHLEHALQWFGGIQGKPVREVCPTGCGHKCNRLRTISAFPKTKSLMGYESELDMSKLKY